MRCLLVRVSVLPVLQTAFGVNFLPNCSSGVWNETTFPWTRICTQYMSTGSSRPRPSLDACVLCVQGMILDTCTHRSVQHANSHTQQSTTDSKYFLRNPYHRCYLGRAVAVLPDPLCCCEPFDDDSVQPPTL